IYIYFFFPHRFREGLMSLGVLDALQKYPLQLKCLFMKSHKVLTAADLENLFQIIHSERVSNAFQDLQDAEFDSSVSLEDILVFFTGCDHVLALSFSPKPRIEFTTHSRFPIANTCENILSIPVHANYTAFQSDMDFAIRN
uniref:HECT domain-containing protein n=1 Tax=Denticeps clupeoides TaxID=299321 RepID=A0AAY4B7L9_9TELE